MKLCTQCRSAFWPYLIAIFIAGVSAFLTWLILGYGDFDMTERLLMATGMFLSVGATLSHYMSACMKRHCNHQKPGPRINKGKLVQPNRPIDA